MKNKLLSRFTEEDLGWCGLLEKGARLAGTLFLKSAFRIDSEVRGSIFSEAKLIVAENAIIEGEIHAADLAVAGRISGKIHASRKVHIMSTGRVSGDVFTPQLEIDPGGILDGICHVPSEGDSAIAIPMKPVFNS